LGGSAFFQSVLILGDGPDQFHEFCLFFIAEQIGDFVCIEQVVDIFDKGLILDFAVSEQEDSGLVFATGLLEDALEVLLLLQLAVGLGDLYLEDLVLADLSGQAGETLSS